MADSMNATLSDPTFENQETLNAPVSNSEQLHNADTVINEEKTQVKAEKSAADPEFVEVPKKELINVNSYFDDYEYICIWTKARGKRKNTRIKQKEQRICAYL